ncbi:enoyl-CoA hydratase/isomerase family protein [Mycobacterium shimoidei]|uniref:Enoyl-CoA hydratase/isomerase [Verminephrobacter eiseniae EF01-2] n=1 Tax=Mycobacterium shimoidei TaxID=29313 RepID=A0A1E3TIU3_MYCSH|nr:enoyl-CoA hydratase/isomerase family protein [Mycobacterium shimoidei]MCV7257290.1 enoyl-CoA hydratase/isomerase family protein [Mycobacterium shimoidei]ODR14372.1 enoyl-CoA hydratase [Mycobacterium shimoidei]ORW80449.1 enoyl-CoA hydratase [Mycobacterium shimoidei]SRX96021.1 enoyl-CoA hydratase/isomerase [Verminephrobacter eiseniae EF01-2] [Mycobacterium shimoidei]
MNTPDVTVELADHVATVEIHRPPNNFFDTALVKGIADAYAQLDDDIDCRVIMLCAEGKHFCAGADFSRPATEVSTPGELYVQALRLFRSAKPVVAAVNGAAIGGGLGLALSADFRVASPSSRFAANFSQLGFHPGFGITATLPRVVGQQKALEWLLTGERFNGEKAYAAGLVDELAADGDVRPAALRFAGRIAASAPLALTSIRATMRAGLAEAVEAATAHELQEQTRLQATDDFREGIAAAAQRRAPVFTGR